MMIEDLIFIDSECPREWVSKAAIADAIRE